MGRLSSSSSGGRLSGSGGSGRLSSKQDLKTIEGLTSYAQSVGLGKEVDKIVNKKQKLSALQRLSAGLGAFNPAEAMLTSAPLDKSPILKDRIKGAGTFVGTYAKNIAQGLASAVTGKEYIKNRRTFKDVAKANGIENKILAGGIGFVGDVLLDPTTYFGGAIAKGIAKGVSGTANVALKGVGKIAPKTEAGLRLAGQGVKDAAGKAFKFGYGTSKGVAEKGLIISSKLDKAKADIVASNLSRLGTGTLSRSQQEELVQKLLEGKRAEFAAGRGTVAGKTAAQEAAKSTDPLVQKTIEEQSIRSKEFAKKAGITDPFEIYFPGLKKDSVRGFIEGTSNLKVGSEGYLKQFRNLLTDEQLVKNPAEAFAKREFDITKDLIVRDELSQVIAQYGKPANAFKNLDDALAAGYRVVREKGQFGKVIGYLLETDKKFLDSLITPEFTSIDMLAKTTGFDALTALFKRSVTGLFPSFHVRNYVSGHIQNFEVLGVNALNPKIIASAQKMAYRLAKDDKNLFKGALGKETQAFADRFGSSSQYIADIADATATGNITKVKSLNPLSAKSLIFRKARAVGNFIETQQKATAFLTARSMGKNVDEALELAARAGFDYRALTGFESKVLRRLIPFYSFTRKNIELQLRTLGENPERINQILALFDNIQSELTEEEKAALPDYAKEGFVLKTGTSKSGLAEIAAGFGTPVEAFAGLFGYGEKNFTEKQLTTLNNIVKYPLEKAVGKDFFKDRPIKDVFYAQEYQKMPQFIKDYLGLRKVVSKDFKTGQEKVRYVADPNKLHLLRQLPTSRGVGYLYNIYNPDTSADTKGLYAFTGIRPSPLDIETIQYFKDKDKREELEDLLIRSGVIKRFENVYVPK